MGKEKQFNPFYDSDFLISCEGDNPENRRLLVELYEDELIQLRNEINVVLRDHFGHNIKE